MIDRDILPMRIAIEQMQRRMAFVEAAATSSAEQLADISTVLRRIECLLAGRVVPAELIDAADIPEFQEVAR
jgi:hypothetical protein